MALNNICFVTPDTIKNSKCDIVINCASEYKICDTPRYLVKKFGIIKNDDFSFLEKMNQILDFIELCLQEKAKIAICDSPEFSRSAGIIIAYLMLNRKFTYDESVDILYCDKINFALHENIENILQCLDDLD